MTLVDPRELVGQQEAAKLAGLAMSSFKLARREGRAPEPVTQLACGPIWTRSQIENWAADRAARRP
jgi:hypothetical protein